MLRVCCWAPAADGVTEALLSFHAYHESQAELARDMAARLDATGWYSRVTLEENWKLPVVVQGPGQSGDVVHPLRR